MHRRISAVFELAAPNHLQRRLIWRRLTSSPGVSLHESVDLDAIALKYEITGGYIRNAVLTALLRAVGRAPLSPKVTQESVPRPLNVPNTPRVAKGDTQKPSLMLSCLGWAHLFADRLSLDSTFVLYWQEDLHEGCREQMRGALQLGGSTQSLHPPTQSVDALLQPTTIKSALTSIVEMEKVAHFLSNLKLLGL